MKLTTNTQRILMELFKMEHKEYAEYLDDNRFFEFFSAQQVMKAYDLSDEEIETGLVGSANDGGCDAIYVLYNGVLVTEDAVENVGTGKNATIDLIIIQAKKESSFGESAIEKWKTTATNLLEIGQKADLYASRYSEAVTDSFAVFRDLYVKQLRNVKRLNIIFAYASFAVDVHPNVQAQADELQREIKKLFPGSQIEVTVDFWNADKLLIAVQKQPETKLNLPLAETPVNIGTYHDFVALVNLAKYYAFITDANGELKKYIFESNVRDYQGNNAVNLDIRDTLENPEGGDFWWYNNGITILTSEASLVTGKELVLKEPAVVNGLQTSNEIFQYYNRNPSALEKETRNVLIRIIVPENEQTRDKIILATNNQTTIPKSSLRVNDPIHWQIEMFFKTRNLYYDRRKNFYRNQGMKNSDIISVSFLAQCMISILLQKPNYARARPSTILMDDVAYSTLYEEDPDLDVFYKIACLGKMVREALKQCGEFTQGEKNDIQFYVLYYVVAEQLKKIIINKNDIKRLELATITEEMVIQCARQIYSIYTNLGGTGKVAKGADLVEHIKAPLINYINGVRY